MAKIEYVVKQEIFFTKGDEQDPRLVVQEDVFPSLDLAQHEAKNLAVRLSKEKNKKELVSGVTTTDWKVKILKRETKESLVELRTEHSFHENLLGEEKKTTGPIKIVEAQRPE